ncbi:MAG: glycosyltransferase involved in cell wall biosynthesis [bacterium]
MTKPKTLFIGSFPKETKGGSSTACLLLLQSEAFSVKNVILLDSTLDNISNNVLASRIWRAVKRFGKLTHIIFTNKPKSVLITCGHGWSFFEKGMMLLYLKAFGVSSVITPNSGLILGSFKSNIFRKYFRFVSKHAKYVVCQGDFWKETFTKYSANPQKLVVIKNWLSPESISKPLLPFSIKERNKINLVYLGWIEAYKGLDDLLQAVALSKKKNNNVHLDIWGEGSYKSHIIEEIEKLDLTFNVKLKGWASELDKSEIYKTQSIAVLSSHYEGMPNVVLEAMANGLPVIASNISTLPEVITHSKNGLLFDVGNIEALAHCIESCGYSILINQQISQKTQASLGNYDLEHASNTLAGLVYDEKKKVLMLTDWFAPGYRAGGPIKSCDNLVKSLSKDIDIKVLTSIYDLGQVKLPVPKNIWVPYQKASVYYAGSFLEYTRKLIGVFLFWRPHKIHINGVFSIKSSIIPLLLTKLTGQRKKVILSLRGMLMPSALHIKSKKKRIYLRIAKSLGLFKNITVHTTNKDELKLSKSSLADFNNITIPNLPDFSRQSTSIKSKEAGVLYIVIVGRVHKIKNIHLLPKFLEQVSGQTHTTLIGHLENREYLHTIELAFDGLQHHEFRYLGEVNGLQVKDIIKQNHLLFLPSQSENYGHAIVESLSQNRPVIISTNTPWQNLMQYTAGFSLKLTEEDTFIKALQYMVDLNQLDYNKYVTGTKKYCAEVVFKDQTKADYLSLYKS